MRAPERGADDVLAKPFFYSELHARIRAVLRRCHERPRHVIQASGLAIDLVVALLSGGVAWRAEDGAGGTPPSQA